MTLADAQAIANLTAKALGLKARPAVEFADIERGEAHLEKGLIRLPRALSKCHATIATYYIAHEICHFRIANHGAAFRKWEDKALAFWNIGVKRGKGPYPLDIFSK